MNGGGWFNEGLQGLTTLDSGLVDVTSKLSRQVDAFVSEIERLNGQLMILENGMPETAPEGRGKRQYSVQVEVFQNKMKEVNRALEVFKAALGHHYQPNLPPEPPLPAPAQPPVVPQAAEGATPRRLSLSEQAHDPEREEGPSKQGANAALGGAFGCARYDLNGGRAAKSARR